MSTNFNDRNADVSSELAYLADKLGNIQDINKYSNIKQIFYNDDDSIRAEIKADSDLHSFVQKMDSNKEKYQDILDNTKLVNTANNTDTGYKGIAIQD